MNPEKLQFDAHFLKSPDFKTSYVSGVYGGLTAKGEFNMCYYVERNVLPTLVTYEFNRDSGDTIEIGREEKSGLVREVQGGLIFDVETAKGIAQWILEKVKAHEQAVDNIKQNRS